MNTTHQKATSAKTITSGCESEQTPSQACRWTWRVPMFALFAVSAACCSFSNQAGAAETAPFVATDASDYPPGSVVYISGGGFAPGEIVQLQVIHVGSTNGDNETSAAHQPWQVSADNEGGIVTTWDVPFDEDELGATLQLTAAGQASGLTAQATFTDASGDVTVTAATGGTNISADKAQNATSPLFTTLGDIVITEPGNGKADFAAGTNVTLILTAPSGWGFKVGTGSVTFAGGRDITAASISVSASTITVTLTVQNNPPNNNGSSPKLVGDF